MPLVGKSGLTDATSRMNENIARVRLGARRACAFAEEALRPRSHKVDWNDYSCKGPNDAADETYLTAVKNLSDSEPYRDDVDSDAGHPSPFCSCKESSAKREAEYSEYDHNVCE